MYYKSWKKLTDKVYMLGSLNEKEKPRTFVTELLREAEKEFVKTGISEGVYFATPTESSPRGGTDTSEIQLPSHIGLIKSVQVNGEVLPRFNSGEIHLNANNEPDVGPPTAWNMLGEDILIFDQKLTSSDSVAVFYESSFPQEDLIIKAFMMVYTNTGTTPTVYVEPIADLEFKTFWDANSLRCFCEDDDGSIVTKISATSVWNTTLKNSQVPNHIGAINVETGTARIEQPAFSNSWKTFGHRGGYQSLTLVGDGASGSTVLRNASHLSLTNYNTNYGPTIRKEHQDYLPYYALGLLLQPVNPNMADYYLNKWTEYLLNIQDRYQDNDLKGQIETTVRSTWRY